MIKIGDITVLVVDDEQDLRDIIGDRFRTHGFKVLTAPSGNTAWELMQSEPVNIVVTDIRMPDGSGIDLLKNIRTKDFDHPRTFVISGFSGFSLDEVYELGADGLFAKPFDTKVLIETIRQAFLPRDDRWQIIPVEHPKASIERRFEDLQSAMDSHTCSLGRGGFFLAIDDGSIEEGEAINFSLEFHKEGVMLRGVGRVMWARRKDEPQRPKGIGVEILYLEDAAREWLVKWIDLKKPVAFIQRN